MINTNKKVVFPLLALSMSMGLVGCNFNIKASDVEKLAGLTENTVEDIKEDMLEIEVSKESDKNVTNDNEIISNIEENNVLLEEEVVTTPEVVEEEIKEEAKEEVKEEVKEKLEEIVVEETKEEIEISNVEFKEHNFNDLTVTLCGKDYSFPLTVNTLVNDGFVFKDEDLNETLETNQYTFGIYGTNANNERVGIRVINLENETKAVKDCNILAFIVSVESNQGKYKTPDFDITWGAKLGVTTLEEFDAFYTEPDRVYNGDAGYATREFTSDSTSFYSDNSIEYKFNDGILNSITIEYYD